MFRSGILALAIGLALPVAASAQDQAGLEEIRRQIQELKDSYESRIQALEKRLQDAEAATAKAQDAASKAQASADASVTVPAPNASGGSSAQITSNAFNPGISLILGGRYANFNEDPASLGVTGFQSAEAAAEELGARGFSLGESELTLSANIDHLFYGQATFAVEGEGEIEVEEAYGQTTALGHGLTVKAGRFFSAIGYQNSLHAHAWDFADAALVQRAFLGNNYADDGVQLSWIAPLPVYLELGGELGRGLNPPGSDRDKNGSGAGTLFARVGGDVGSGGSYRVGVSALTTSTDSNGISINDLNDITGAVNLFNGQTRLYGVDAVYKWAPAGNSGERNLKLITEWFTLRRNGTLDFDADGALGVGPATESYVQRQYGWYVQGVYQFRPQWRLGLRYDQLQQGSLEAGPIASANGVVEADFTPRRYAAMIDWNPSEFSRLRLQYNYDQSKQQVTDHQFILQYIYSLGAHGAHQF